MLCQEFIPTWAKAMETPEPKRAQSMKTIDKAMQILQAVDADFVQ